MSKVIDVYENKVLKLKNVFSQTLVIDEKFTNKPLELYYKDFIDYMKNNKIEGFGPIVVYNSIIGSDEKKMILKLLRQTKNEHISCVYPYEYQEEIKTKPCLFSRFNGYEKDAINQSYKMQVYAYENDLVLDIESYTISKQEEDKVSVDVFIPILGRC